MRGIRDLEPAIDTYGLIPTEALIHLHMDPPGPVPGKGEHHVAMATLPAEAIDAFVAANGADSGSRHPDRGDPPPRRRDRPPRRVPRRGRTSTPSTSRSRPRWRPRPTWPRRPTRTSGAWTRRSRPTRARASTSTSRRTPPSRASSSRSHARPAARRQGAGGSRGDLPVQPADRLSRLQVGQHGEHAAMVRVARRQVELPEDVGDVLLDRARADHQAPAPMAAFDRPSAISSSTSRSRGVSSDRRLSRAAAAQELGDDLRVERRAARGHAPRGVDELGRGRRPGP